MCMSMTMCVPCAHRGQRRELYPLELDGVTDGNKQPCGCREMTWVPKVYSGLLSHFSSP